MSLPELAYNEKGLIPCIVQDANTREVLMMAWINEEALRLTLDQKSMHFWSRSRGELWHKGATSKNTQELVELRYDCDADTLLALVTPAGPACHTGSTSCFFGTLPFPTGTHPAPNRETAAAPEEGEAPESGIHPRERSRARGANRY
ncbi:MAG: phosphoribosyl-AMP cyclohydrolase [Coriobacteriaceae bacterium]|nr:phosphoribosyl-AMP cyclohydrolase [Coriobacteriaceae bacterium]